MIRLSGLCLILAAGALLSGCASRGESKAVAAAPTLDELPTYEYLEPTIPIRVGIVGETARRPTREIVRMPQEIPLTEREKAILERGKKPEGVDPLAFYRPEKGPEDGILPQKVRVPDLAYGLGGVSSGMHGFSPSVSVYGVGGAARGEYRFPSRVSSIYWPRAASAAVGPRSAVVVGEGPRRGIAGRHGKYAR